MAVAALKKIISPLQPKLMQNCGILPRLIFLGHSLGTPILHDCIWVSCEGCRMVYKAARQKPSLFAGMLEMGSGWVG